MAPLADQRPQPLQWYQGFDDPVPSDSTILPTEETSLPHDVEQTVQRLLLQQPELCFSSLVVRRMNDGICIQGILESTNGMDVEALVRQVAGVGRVVNRLVVQSETSCRPRD